MGANGVAVQGFSMAAILVCARAAARLRMVEAVLNEHDEIVTEFALIGLGSAGQVNQGTVVARMADSSQFDGNCGVLIGTLSVWPSMVIVLLS